VRSYHACVRRVSAFITLSCCTVCVRAQLLDLLVSSGATVNARSADGFTPLHRAVVARSFAGAEFLLARGAQVNAQTRAGQTPFFCAAVSESVPMMRVLLDGGADPAIADGKNVTPVRALRERHISQSRVAAVRFLESELASRLPAQAVRSVSPCV
jgi:ankyrin repeat protein